MESQAKKAIRRDWASEEIRDYLNRIVKKWGEVLGIEICTSFDHTGNGGTRDGEISFTQVFAEDVRKAPDIIVGHEAGHCLEHEKTGWSTEEFRKNENYLQEYIRQGFERERHRMPPFSLTQYHQVHQGKIFDRENLRQSIGYNARQIYCDSIPFKEVLVRELTSDDPILGDNGRPLTIDRLIGQYLNYMDGQYNELTGAAGELVDHLPKGQIPVVARFGASAWAMEYLASEIQNKKQSRKRINQLRDWSDRFLRLFGRPDLRKREILKIRETPQERIDGGTMELVEKFSGNAGGAKPISGLMPEEVNSIIILIRAYKRHFLMCVSRKELIHADDLRPHFESLKDRTESEKIRVIHLLSELGDIRSLAPLVERIEDRVEKQEVKIETISAIGEIVVENPGKKNVVDTICRFIGSLNKEDPSLRYAGYDVWSLAVEANPNNKKMLASAPDFTDLLESPGKSFLFWDFAGMGIRLKGELGLDSIRKLVLYFKDPRPAVRAAAIQMWTKIGRNNHSAKAVLNSIGKVVECLKDPNAAVRSAALFAYGDITEDNPDTDEPLEFIANITDCFSDSNPAVRLGAVDALMCASYAHQNHEAILNSFQHLVKLINDPDDSVESQARAAFMAIAGNNPDDPRITKPLER